MDNITNQTVHIIKHPVSCVLWYQKEAHVIIFSSSFFFILGHQPSLPSTTVPIGTNPLTSSVNGVGSTSVSTTVNGGFPPKSQIKRQKMVYHCKFGEFGVLEGQFTEPSGVAVNAQNDIVVADTNNHRYIWKRSIYYLENGKSISRTMDSEFFLTCWL